MNAQTIIRTIDSRLYGINIAVWDSHLASPSTATVLSAMQTGAIRFPGGSTSDDFDWEAGRGGGRGRGNNAATFAKVTETQGAQAFVTVNYGSGTPELAAAWVAYYNGSPSSTASLGVDSKGRDWKTVGYWASIRAGAPLAADDGYNFLRASHPAPFGFKYWEVGNECYGGWEHDVHGTPGSGLSGLPHDPATYATAFQAFYTQMHAVDPSIKIGAVAQPVENGSGRRRRGGASPANGNTPHGWTPVVLSTLKSLGVTPEFLIDHRYAQEPGRGKRRLPPPGRRETRIRRAEFEEIDRHIPRRFRQFRRAGRDGTQFRQLEPRQAKHQPGERPLHGRRHRAPRQDRIQRLHLVGPLRNGGGSNANNSPLLYGWRQNGDYGVVGGRDGSTPDPSFYAAKLLTHWGRGGDAVVNATSSYALLSIYAAKLANGSLALLVINKHPTANLTAQITLNGFTPASATASVYSYGKPNDQSRANLTTGTAAIPGPAFTYTFPSYSMSVLVLKGQ